MIQDLIICLPFFVCLLLSAELAVTLVQQLDRARACLLVWSLTATVLYGMHYIFFSQVTEVLPVSDSIYTAANLAVYPLYLIYINELTDDHPLRYRLMMTAVVLVFSIACGCLVAWIYAQMSPAELKMFVDDYLMHQPSSTMTGWAGLQVAVHDVCRMLFTVSVVYTCVVGIMRIARYNKLVESLYADTEEKKLHRIGVLLGLLLLTSVLSVTVNILGRHSFVSSTWLALPSVLFSCLLFLIGHEGLNCRFSIRDIERDEAYELPLLQQRVVSATAAVGGEQEVGGEVWENNASPTIVQKLRHAVEEERLFTQPDLKLDDLARQLGTNRTYLLRTMKQELKMSFSEYINRQRIAYAQSLMKQHPDRSKVDIATQVGYASLSSFYRNLREYAGGG